MVIQSARNAINTLLTREFRSILWKSIGLTILLFVGAWIGIENVFSIFLAPSLGNWPWVSTAVIWLLGTGVFIGAGFLLAPVTALFAGLFLDDAAQYVEEIYYDKEPPGTPVPLAKSIWLTIRFTTLVTFANLLALILVLLPGVNIIIFFLLNGYLLGREYFMFAAMRYRSEDEARKIRQDNSTTVLLAGLIIAGFMAVPVLNLATPIFAVAMMVHLHKSVA